MGYWRTDGTIKTGNRIEGALVVDLNATYNEQSKDNPLSSLTSDESSNVIGLYDVVRMIHYAETDTAIKGIYINGGYDPNGFATNEETTYSH